MVVYLNQATEMQLKQPAVFNITSTGATSIVSNFTTANIDTVVTGLSVFNNTNQQHTFDVIFRAGSNVVYLCKNMPINNYHTVQVITEQTPIYLPNGSLLTTLRFQTNTVSSPINFVVTTNYYSVEQ